MKKTTFSLVGAAVAVLPILLVPASAQAAGKCQPVETRDYVRLCSGDGDTLRAILYDNVNKQGGRIEYYGGSSCTATTADNEYSKSVMPKSWNDRVSLISDYAKCDVKLYVNGPLVDDPRDATDVTGYINYGAGKYVGQRYNDKLSSFRVS